MSTLSGLSATNASVSGSRRVPSLASLNLEDEGVTKDGHSRGVTGIVDLSHMAVGRERAAIRYRTSRHCCFPIGMCCRLKNERHRRKEVGMIDHATRAWDERDPVAKNILQGAMAEKCGSYL